MRQNLLCVLPGTVGFLLFAESFKAWPVAVSQVFPGGRTVGQHHYFRPFAVRAIDSYTPKGHMDTRNEDKKVLSSFW